MIVNIRIAARLCEAISIYIVRLWAVNILLGSLNSMGIEYKSHRIRQGGIYSKYQAFVTAKVLEHVTHP
jgi:hypothetical protein